jgi:hypothetical protein
MTMHSGFCWGNSEQKDLHLISYYMPFPWWCLENIKTHVDTYRHGEILFLVEFHLSIIFSLPKGSGK